MYYTGKSELSDVYNVLQSVCHPIKQRHYFFCGLVKVGHHNCFAASRKRRADSVLRILKRDTFFGVKTQPLCRAKVNIGGRFAALDLARAYDLVKKAVELNRL